MNKPVVVMLVVSILMQAGAACIAFVQWPLALRYRLAWISISAALLLMIERRVESLWNVLHGNQVGLMNEIVGLVISVLMLFGVLGLRHLFFHLHRQEAKLKHQANIDYLTGVFNRRYFTQQGKLNLARAQRYGTPLSLIMLDIDLFKNVNDIHGHDQGDKVLVKLCHLCKKELRKVDILGRIGGEEFAVLLPETGLDQALEVAERLRSVVDETEMLLAGDGSLHFTISLGVATLGPEDSLDRLLMAADRALYDAKHTGRNRVCHATPA
jgi:diguanylate cyclase (GGDEF)-like protein